MSWSSLGELTPLAGLEGSVQGGRRKGKGEGGGKENKEKEEKRRVKTPK